MGLHLFYTILQFLNVALSKALHCHYEHMGLSRKNTRHCFYPVKMNIEPADSAGT